MNTVVTNLLASLFCHRAKRSANIRFIRPLLEPLEDRLAPAVDVSFDGGRDELVIRSLDDVDDVIIIEDDDGKVLVNGEHLGLVARRWSSVAKIFITTTGATGRDTVRIDPDNNSSALDNIPVNVNAGPGGIEFDARSVGSAKVSLSGVNPGNDTFLGGGGDDFIFAGGGNDFIDGGGGNDEIRALNGNCTLVGGIGDDTIDVSGGNNFILGGAGNDSITVAGGDNVITGGDGDDTITGGDGDDDISGGAGNDTIDGGAGNDTINGDAGADSIFGGAGDDTIRGGDGNDTIRGGLGDDSIDGGAGQDRLEESGDVNFVLTNSTLTGLDTDTLFSIEQAELTGGDANNVIDASIFTGSTTLNGGLGNDTIIGGAGNDSIDGGAGNDTLKGGPGADTLLGQAGNDRLQGGAGNDVLNGGPGADTLLGQAGNDLLQGSAGNDTLNGGPGKDRLLGGPGNDTAVAPQTGDTVNLGSGQDGLVIAGTQGNDVIVVHRLLAADGRPHAVIQINRRTIDVPYLKGETVTVHGRGGHDLIVMDDSAFTWSGALFGGPGDDILIGGAGHDLLVGGPGRDTLLGADDEPDIRQ